MYAFEQRLKAPGAEWRTVAVFYSLIGARAFACNTERDANYSWRIIAR